MAYAIGDRVIVPYADGAQGMVVGVSTTGGFSLIGIMPLCFVTLRYIGRQGAQIDQTISLSDVEAANPPPVDVDALRKQIRQQGDELRVAGTHLRGQLADKRKATAKCKAKRR